GATRPSFIEGEPTSEVRQGDRAAAAEFADDEALGRGRATAAHRARALQLQVEPRNLSQHRPEPLVIGRLVHSSKASFTGCRRTAAAVPVAGRRSLDKTQVGGAGFLPATASCL